MFKLRWPLSQPLRCQGKANDSSWCKSFCHGNPGQADQTCLDIILLFSLPYPTVSKADFKLFKSKRFSPLRIRFSRDPNAKVRTGKNTRVATRINIRTRFGLLCLTPILAATMLSCSSKPSCKSCETPFLCSNPERPTN